MEVEVEDEATSETEVSEANEVIAILHLFLFFSKYFRVYLFYLL